MQAVFAGLSLSTQRINALEQNHRSKCRPKAFNGRTDDLKMAVLWGKLQERDGGKGYFGRMCEREFGEAVFRPSEVVFGYRMTGKGTGVIETIS